MSQIQFDDPDAFFFSADNAESEICEVVSPWASPAVSIHAVAGSYQTEKVRGIQQHHHILRKFIASYILLQHLPPPVVLLIHPPPPLPPPPLPLPPPATSNPLPFLPIPRSTPNPLRSTHYPDLSHSRPIKHPNPRNPFPDPLPFPPLSPATTRKNLPLPPAHPHIPIPFTPLLQRISQGLGVGRRGSRMPEQGPRDADLAQLGEDPFVDGDEEVDGGDFVFDARVAGVERRSPECPVSTLTLRLDEVAEGSDGGAEEGPEGLGEGYDAVEEVGVDAPAETEWAPKPAERGSRKVRRLVRWATVLNSKGKAGLSLTRLRSRVRRRWDLDRAGKQFSAKLACGATNSSSWFLVRPSRRAAFNQFAERALTHVQVDGGADGAHELVEVAAVEVGSLLGLFGCGNVGEDFEDDLVGEVDRSVRPGGIDLIAVFIPALGLLYVPVALLVERHGVMSPKKEYGAQCYFDVYFRLSHADNPEMHALKRIMTSSLRLRRKSKRKHPALQTSGTSASPESFPPGSQTSPQHQQQHQRWPSVSRSRPHISTSSSPPPDPSIPQITMLGLRTFQRATRAPAFRQTLQRRFASAEQGPSGVGLDGEAMKNAFNSERAAVKEHAAATSGKWTCEPLASLVSGNLGMGGKDGGCVDVRYLWRKLSIYVVIPAIAIAGANAYRLWVEHWEHKSHDPPLEEQPEYPYQNIRTKNFFWGDGDKVRLTFLLCLVREGDLGRMEIWETGIGRGWGREVMQWDYCGSLGCEMESSPAFDYWSSDLVTLFWNPNVNKHNNVENLGGLCLVEAVFSYVNTIYLLSKSQHLIIYTWKSHKHPVIPFSLEHGANLKPTPSPHTHALLPLQPRAHKPVPEVLLIVATLSLPDLVPLRRPKAGTIRRENFIDQHDLDPAGFGVVAGLFDRKEGGLVGDGVGRWAPTSSLALAGEIFSSCAPCSALVEGVQIGFSNF
ncbi:hypothetical protein KC333_g39 [Hortaea werneckii]|nr:hypothetical protein KC333_g39 [Hortaea werneckii]